MLHIKFLLPHSYYSRECFPFCLLIVRESSDPQTEHGRKRKQYTWHSQCEVWWLPACKNNIFKLNPENKWENYMLCNFVLVNFSVGEVLGRDLHFVASVKALITLKTKPSLRSEEACLEWSTVTCLNLQNFKKDWNFCFDQCYVMKTCCSKQILTSGKIFYANLVKIWQL